MKGQVRGGRGELTVENRHSPEPLIYRLVDGERLVIAAGETARLPTLTCSHCNCTVVLHPQRSKPRRWCRRCNHYVCDAPGCNRDCTPILDCVELALQPRYAGVPLLPRAKDGGVLFDRALIDRLRVF